MGCNEIGGFFVDFSNDALEKCLGAFTMASE